jgi:hypothetical protein
MIFRALAYIGKKLFIEEQQGFKGSRGQGRTTELRRYESVLLKEN